MTITHHFSLFLLLDSQVVPRGKNKPPYDKYTGTPTIFKDYKSEKVEVLYPIGHKNRRNEGIPELIKNKLLK